MRTYQEVCEIIEDMVKSNEKITVRNVLTRSGGTAAKIAEYVKRWHMEQGVGIDTAISENLQKAIINDRNSAIDKAVEYHKGQITFLNEALQDVQALLKEKEETLVNCNDKANGLNTQLIEANQRNTMYVESISDLEHKLETNTKAYNNAATECAKALERVKSAEGLVIELKQQVKELQEKLALESKARHLAEKDAAVWQSKCEHK